MDVVAQDAVTTADSLVSPGTGVTNIDDDEGTTTKTAYFVTKTEREWRPDSSVVLTETCDQDRNQRNAFSANDCISGSRSNLGRFEIRHQPPARTSTPTQSSDQKQQKTVVRRLYRRSVIDADQYMAFIPLKGRKENTMSAIQTSIQRRTKERVCRPYSTYSVPKTCDRFSIGPYGLPFESGATGRFKVGSLSRSYPGLENCNSLFKTNEQNRRSRLNEELNLIVTELPHGTGVLRRPPDRHFREIKQMSTPRIHSVANERMTAVRDTLARSQNSKPSPAEYNVAVELVVQLQDQRKESSCFKVPYYMCMKPEIQLPAGVDIEQTPVQMIHYMTKGELSLIEGKKANNFNPNCPKKPSTKFVQKPKRTKSPPLSIITKELFFPEVKLVREEEKSKRIHDRKGILVRGLSSNGRRKSIDDDEGSRKSINEVRSSSAGDELDFHLDGVSMDLKSIKSLGNHSRLESRERFVEFTASTEQSVSKTPDYETASRTTANDIDRLSIGRECVNGTDDTCDRNLHRPISTLSEEDQSSYVDQSTSTDKGDKPQVNETNNNDIIDTNYIDNSGNEPAIECAIVNNVNTDYGIETSETDHLEGDDEDIPSDHLEGDDEDIPSDHLEGDDEDIPPDRANIIQRPMESDISIDEDVTANETLKDDFNYSDKGVHDVGGDVQVGKDDIIRTTRVETGGMDVENVSTYLSHRPSVASTDVDVFEKVNDAEDPGKPTSIDNDTNYENCETSDEGQATENIDVCTIVNGDSNNEEGNITSE